MELISEIIGIMSSLKESAKYCEIYKNSKIYWTGSTVGENDFLSATIDIYRVEEVRIKIDGGVVFLNGFLSNPSAVISHLNNLQDNLDILEEAM